MIGVEIFSGVGGLSLGASMAGVEIALAVEIDKHAAATFKYNHPTAEVIISDICDVKEIKIEVKKDQKKILFGGPPCQGFSKSNRKNRNKDNSKNWLFEEYLRITKIWKPDWIVLENVQGLVETENGLFLKKILQGFRDLGYTVDYQVLNAKYFGVPQSRERLFIVGSLHNIKYNFPVACNSEIVTVRDAFIDLPDLENGNVDVNLDYKDLFSTYSNLVRQNINFCSNNGVSKNTSTVVERYYHIKQGGNWKSVPLELMKSYADVSRCHTGIYHRLDESKPSVVIGNYRKNMLIHPWQNRGLSVREAARLQSFPDSFKFLGTLNNQQQQVGNAVPPFLAKAIFDNILKL